MLCGLVSIVITLIVFACLYLYCRITCGKTKSVTCLMGKTALVTGGNDGIGYQVCLNLASRGCRVIIADKDDSEKSRRQIIEQTNNSNIISKKFDLSSFKSVRNLAKEINESEERLDILINNAGAGALPENVTEDGLNVLLQVNHFGGFLLTHLLIGLLKKSAPSRIIFTSSPTAYIACLKPEDLLIKKFKDGFLNKTFVYTNTKLAAVIIAESFAEKLKGTGIAAFSVNPGWVRTQIWNKSKDAGNWSLWIGSILGSIWGYVVGKNVWEGAQTTTHVATDQNLEQNSGDLFWDCHSFRKPKQVKGEMFWPLSALGFDPQKDFSQKIWKISEECCQLQENERI